MAGRTLFPAGTRAVTTPPAVFRRVEMWRGGLGMAYRSGPFVCRGFTSPPMLRFHIPLRKPDVRISRIRLSDKGSGVRTREVTPGPPKADQTEAKVQVFRREP